MGLNAWSKSAAGFLATALVTATAAARSLDEKGEIGLGLRSYVSARIQTEHTDKSFFTDPQGVQTLRSLTFPISPDGHVRQNRWFVEVDLKHDLLRLYRDGWGALRLLHYLPFDLQTLKYNLVYRGEGDGVYNWGPSEFRTARQVRDPQAVPPSPLGPAIQGPFAGAPASAPPGNPAQDVGFFRHELRRRLNDRHRLFEAFLDVDAGNFFVRFGRQILVWGETDAFRLLDNINPTDNGFGGFLLPLDERRVPLDMLRINYYLGDFRSLPTWLKPLGLLSHLGLNEAILEGFVAYDDKVGWDPGINIKGSAWALPNLGDPSATQLDLLDPPSRSFRDARGGFQFKFNAPLPGIEEATVGVAHYYTHFDTPQVQILVPLAFPLFFQSPEQPWDRFGAIAYQSAPLVQVSGLSSTFAIPARWSRRLGMSGEPIVRTELAYFKNEPRHSQTHMDPFYFADTRVDPGHPCARGKIVRFRGEEMCSGDNDPGDSWNFVLGVDLNQFVPALNARNSFFITTQFFYKHLNGAARRRPYDRATYGVPGLPLIQEGEVLPVPASRQQPSALPGVPNGAVEPNLVHNARDQFLQTLLIGTSYASGQIVPNLTLLYDWSGAFTAIPQITFVRDPFRLVVSYSFLAANRLKGNSGVSLLRDRDNFLVQVEYVL